MIPRISQLPQVSTEYKKFFNRSKNARPFPETLKIVYPHVCCAQPTTAYIMLAAAVIFPKQ